LTDADFIDTVADKLGILGAGQTLSNEDAALIRRYRIGTFARVAAELETTVANIDDVPDAQSLALADLVAFDCATAFQISGSKLGELLSLANAAINTLRVVTAEQAYKDTLTQGRWWGPSRAGTYRGVG